LIKLNISVVARDGQLPESVVQTIHRKLEKLPRFFERMTGADVVVRLKNADNPTVECKVSAEETADFFATDSGHNVITALDKVLHKIEQQLKKHKEKLTDHRVGKNQRLEDSSREN
jgi:putative sigma-54 modulation protein